jgi:prespore-specific regulator
MTKVRQDAWSHEDDLLLAETVLRHIREGSTQLKAFDEIGDQLNRTSAACGFRWNAEIRQQYEQAIAIAKKQRKEKKRALVTKKQTKSTLSVLSVLDQQPVSHEQETSSLITPSVQIEKQAITFQDVILFLQNMQYEHPSAQHIKEENISLKQENDMLKQEYERLQHRYAILTEQQNGIQEDYQALMNIMDRARKLVLFEDSEDRMAPIFKMDKNGNLEIVSN